MNGTDRVLFAALIGGVLLIANLEWAVARHIAKKEEMHDVSARGQSGHADAAQPTDPESRVVRVRRPAPERLRALHEMTDQPMRLPCPSCPDGNEWAADGPTGRACRTCGGKAYIEPGKGENSD